MKQKTEKKKLSSHPEAKGLIFIGASLILLLSLMSYTSGSASSNWLGLVGFGTAWIFNYLFGIASYLFAFYGIWCGFQLLVHGQIEHRVSRNIYFSLFVFSLCILLNLVSEKGLLPFNAMKEKIYSESILLDLPYPHVHIRYNMGGVPAYYLYRDLPLINLQRLLSDFGIALTFSTTALVSFLLFTQVKLATFLKRVKKIGLLVKALFSKLLEKRSKQEEPADKLSNEQLEKKLSRPFPQPLYPIGKDKPAAPVEEVEEKPKRAPSKTLSHPTSELKDYQLPPISLLKVPKKVDQPTLKKDLRKQADVLEEALLSFGIEAKVGEIYCGPTITSFEVHPAVGVKVQKIKSLENDLALNLQAKSIRIIAPIPGKAAVGVEIPSLHPQEVSFRELLSQYQEGSRRFHIPILLGKTVGGECVMTDLAKMPHCLIAGATGSGKSVCINTIILSIVMNARPDEIKLLMIDPKKVELTGYAHLPHMIAPVINEPHGAYNALNWLVKEMQLRYEILKQLGLRNIGSFNAREPNRELEESLGMAIPMKMHAIVAIIDEFADLMMASSSDLETPIARIAQMARAVGIHLILATQRPSREVITGLIKANFPTRIAFKVASRINSQIILDDTGADSLLGNGDMLFLPPGTSQLMRAQGAYVSDEEINRIIKFIEEQAPTNYLISSFDTMRREEGTSESLSDDNSRDSLYDQALSIVLETQTASTTYLQRKLKIGYARAASLMDELEMKGVIGPQEGAKPRRILQKPDALKSGGDKKFLFDEE